MKYFQCENLLQLLKGGGLRRQHGRRWEKRSEENLEDQHPIKVEGLWLEVNDKYNSNKDQLVKRGIIQNAHDKVCALCFEEEKDIPIYYSNAEFVEDHGK